MTSTVATEAQERVASLRQWLEQSRATVEAHEKELLAEEEAVWQTHKKQLERCFPGQLS